MKKFLKKWIVPTGIFEYVRLRGANKISHPENTKFKNIHKGERCFILASGPSITQQELSVLEGETCIAVSHFHLHKDIRTIKPKYHVLAPSHPPFTFNDSGKYFSDFKEKYADMDVTYFLGDNSFPYSFRKLVQTHPELSVNNAYYLNYEPGFDIDEENYSQNNIWDISKTVFSPRTVIYSALQVAGYMGFSEIYLLGCDHDYLNDTKRTTNHHFYKEEAGISDKEHLDAFSSEKWFYEYYMRWKHYRLMRMALEEKGCKVYNATRGGMLDVFERVEFETLFNRER